MEKSRKVFEPVGGEKSQGSKVAEPGVKKRVARHLDRWVKKRRKVFEPVGGKKSQWGGVKKKKSRKVFEPVGGEKS